jgi:hypothetical protein
MTDLHYLLAAEALRLFRTRQLSRWNWSRQ